MNGNVTIAVLNPSDQFNATKNPGMKTSTIIVCGEKHGNNYRGYKYFVKNLKVHTKRSR